MMHGREKSDRHSSVKPTNKAAGRCGAGGAKGGGQGECEPAKHASDTVPKSVSQALERIRQVRRHSPKVGAVWEFCTHGSVRGAVSNGRPYRTSQRVFPPLTQAVSNSLDPKATFGRLALG